MKIFLLHGEDTVKSYERLKKFIDTARKRSWEVVSLDDASSDFRDDLLAVSLFGSERFFILRNIKKFGKTESEWLAANQDKIAGNLVFYVEGKAGVTLTKNLPKNAVIEEFPMPILIWNFLDSIKKGNVKEVLKVLHKIVEKDPVERVFVLIFKLFRDLYWVKKEPESINYQSWRVEKLKRQASLFTLQELEEIIASLAKIDIEVKTGQSSLLSSLDLLMVKILE